MKDISQWLLRYAANSEPETIRHLLYMCPIVNLFWHRLADFIKSNTNSVFEPSYTLIIFGCRDRIFNYILLRAKYYIYICKCSERTISFPAFLFNLKAFYNTEKYISLTTGKINKLNSSWEMWNHCLIYIDFFFI